MADPHLPGVVRCLAITRSTSGLPEDDVVNSWAFQAAWSSEDTGSIQQIANALQTFYNALSNHRSYNVSLATMEFRFYDLATPPPRLPGIVERSVQMAQVDSLPEEVAVCLSYYSGRNLPRNRGRLYLGPLSPNAVAVGSGRTFVASGLRTNIRNAAQALLDASDAAELWTWGLISQRDAAFKPITAGWVDDSFDTQRSRGPAPSTRTTFGVV